MARGRVDGSVDECTNIRILYITHKAPGGIGGRGVREVEACGCGAGVGAGARGRGGGAAGGGSGRSTAAAARGV